MDFVMTALFVVMFIDQWEDAQDHKPALVGIVCSVICLVIFGRRKFILPSMASIVLCFLGMKKHEEKRKKNVYRSQENIRHDSWDIAGKYALRTAGDDRNTVHCGIT